MNATKLRDDEEFVISKLAEWLSRENPLKWWPGEDPPDCYIEHGGSVTAVEISTLVQHVTDESGKTIPRLTQDTTALRFSDELDAALKQSIPKGRTVILTLNAPIQELRRLRERLIERISGLIAENPESEVETEDVILNNEIGIHITNHERPTGKKVVGIVANSSSSPHILSNARFILDQRIREKEEKCSRISFAGPKWLALLNDYWIADEETYQMAMKQSKIRHAFDKVFLIRGDGLVVPIYEKSD